MYKFERPICIFMFAYARDGNFFHKTNEFLSRYYQHQTILCEALAMLSTSFFRTHVAIAAKSESPYILESGCSICCRFGGHQYLRTS